MSWHDAVLMQLLSDGVSFLYMKGHGPFPPIQPVLIDLSLARKALISELSQPQNAGHD